jgi:hypothetical protein
MLTSVPTPSTEGNAMRRIAGVSGLLALVLLTGAPAPADALTPAAALDGRSFDVVVTEEGKESGDKDQIVFKDQQFESVGCRQYGFGPVAYTTELSDGVVTFQATSTSPTDGTIEWRGTVEADRIEGQMLWHKQGQKDLAYSYAGTLAPAPAATGAGVER